MSGDFCDDPAAWRALGETIEWRGHRLFVRSEGQGEPLLLLHGFPTSSWDWKDVWSALLPGRRLISFDYLGFGFSDKPRDGNYSIFGYADQVEAVLAHEKLTSVHVLAHDLGDTVAQELLARDLERRAGTRPAAIAIATCCMLNGGVLPETHHPRLVQKLLASPLGYLFTFVINRRVFGKSMTPLFGPDTPPSARDLDGFWAGVNEQRGVRIYHKLIGYMAERRVHRERWVRPILGDDGAGGPVPFAMVNGLVDPVSGAHVVERLRALLPQVKVYELPRIGHYPQTEAPSQVVEAYRSFRETAQTT